MVSNSGRKYGSSGRSGSRKRVVIGADETVRVRYKQNQPQVEAERRLTPRQSRPGARSPQAGQSRTSKQARQVSASKKLERERRQRSIRLKRGALYAVGLVAVLLVAWGIVAIYRAPILPIRTIEVSGLKHLDKATVVALAQVPSDATLVRVPSGKIVARLQSDPWIGSARVEKRFPGTLRLVVEERRSAAIVDAGGTNVWVISGDGYWLGKRTTRDKGMIVIRDIPGVVPTAGRRTSSKELLNALKIVAGISPELRGMTTVLSAPTIDKTALITDDDVEVFIGDASQLVAKDRIVRQILQKKKGEVVYINVRVVESPIWRGLGAPK